MPVRVDLITDMASEAVLHWGITKPGSRDWVLPPEELWPEMTKIAGLRGKRMLGYNVS